MRCSKEKAASIGGILLPGLLALSASSGLGAGFQRMTAICTFRRFPAAVQLAATEPSRKLANSHLLSHYLQVQFGERAFDRHFIDRLFLQLHATGD